MFFTLKLLKLGLRLVLLPFRVVAKLFRFIVGFAVGRARGSASTESRDRSEHDGPEGTPDPIRDPNRENETPGGSPTEATGQATTASASSDASTTASAGAPAASDSLLSPTQYAGVLGALAVGQLLGLLAYEGNVDAVAGAIVDVRFVAATPLFDAVYWGVLDAGGDWLYPVVAVAYAALYGGVGWLTYDQGAVPSKFARPVAGIFAANAVAYALTPLFYVNEVPFFSDYVGYYTSGGTLVQVVVYGALMGLLYVSTPRLVGRPTTPPAAAGDAAAGAEPAPWARDGETTTSTTAAAGEQSGDAAGENESSDPLVAAPRNEAAESDSPAAGATGDAAPVGDGAESAADPVDDDETDTAEPVSEPEPATEQPTDAATAEAGATTTDTESTDGEDESIDSESESGDAGATPIDGSEAVETTNDAEAALGRLAADDADSRLAAASDLQALGADGHDYLTGEHLADALDDEPDPEVRAALVDALAAVDTDAATEALRDARFDSNPTVSDRAAEHLD